MNGRFIILGWPTQMIFAIDGSADDDVENLPMNRGNQKDTEPQLFWDAEVERFVVGFCGSSAVLLGDEPVTSAVSRQHFFE